MKKTISFTMITGCMVLVLFSSCREKLEKKHIEDSEENLEVVVKETKDDIKTTVKKDWEKFKNESELVIKNTENRVTELRDKISKFDKKEQEKLHKTLDSLEQKNTRLKERLAQRAHEFKEDLIVFNTSTKEKEQKFEQEVKHDIDEIKKALKKIITPDDSILDE